MPRATHARRTPAQLVKEAYQIARDHHLHIKETSTDKGTQFSVFRIVPGGRAVLIGKRSSPAGIRTFVAHAAEFH